MSVTLYLFLFVWRFLLFLIFRLESLEQLFYHSWHGVASPYILIKWLKSLSFSTEEVSFCKMNALSSLFVARRSNKPHRVKHFFSVFSAQLNIFMIKEIIWYATFFIICFVYIQFSVFCLFINYYFICFVAFHLSANATRCLKFPTWG